MAKPPNSSYNRIASILQTLGDTSTLGLFNEANQGFKSGKEVIKKLQLTSRKYYTCLNELSGLGLIESSGKIYMLSPLGRVLHRIIFNDILPIISPEIQLPDTFSMMRLRNELSIIDNYGDTVRLIINAVDQSRLTIEITTRYIDLAIIQSILQATKRGIKSRIIADTSIDSTNLFKLLMTTARSTRQLVEQSTSNIPNIRSNEVLVPIAIVDEVVSIFEFPSKDFKMAFFTTESRPVKMLSDYFQTLWSRSITIS